MTSVQSRRPTGEAGVSLLAVMFGALGSGFGGLLGVGLARGSGQFPVPIAGALGAALGLLTGLVLAWVSDRMVGKPPRQPYELALEKAGLVQPYAFAGIAFGVVGLPGQDEEAFEGYIAIGLTTVTLVPSDGSGAIPIPQAGISIFRLSAMPGGAGLILGTLVLGTLTLDPTVDASGGRYDVVDLTYPGGRTTLRLDRTVPDDVLRDRGIPLVTDRYLSRPVLERALAPFRTGGGSSS